MELRRTDPFARMEDCSRRLADSLQAVFPPRKYSGPESLLRRALKSRISLYFGLESGSERTDSLATLAAAGGKLSREVRKAIERRTFLVLRKLWALRSHEPYRLPWMPATHGKQHLLDLITDRSTQQHIAEAYLHFENLCEPRGPRSIWVTLPYYDVDLYKIIRPLRPPMPGRSPEALRVESFNWIQGRIPPFAHLNQDEAEELAKRAKHLIKDEQYDPALPQDGIREYENISNACWAIAEVIDPTKSHLRTAWPPRKTHFPLPLWPPDLTAAICDRIKSTKQELGRIIDSGWQSHPPRLEKPVLNTTPDFEDSNQSRGYAIMNLIRVHETTTMCEKCEASLPEDVRIECQSLEEWIRRLAEIIMIPNEGVSIYHVAHRLEAINRWIVHETATALEWRFQSAELSSQPDTTSNVEYLGKALDRFGDPKEAVETPGGFITGDSGLMTRVGEVVKDLKEYLGRDFLLRGGVRARYLKPHAYMILGEPGTGKTSLSRTICDELDGWLQGDDARGKGLVARDDRKEVRLRVEPFEVNIAEIPNRASLFERIRTYAEAAEDQNRRRHPAFKAEVDGKASKRKKGAPLQQQWDLGHDDPVVPFFIIDEVDSRIEGSHVYPLFLRLLEDGKLRTAEREIDCTSSIWFFISSRYTQSQEFVLEAESGTIEKQKDFWSRLSNTIDLRPISKPSHLEERMFVSLGLLHKYSQREEIKVGGDLLAYLAIWSPRYNHREVWRWIGDAMSSTLEPKDQPTEFGLDWFMRNRVDPRVSAVMRDLSVKLAVFQGREFKRPRRDGPSVQDRERG